MRMPLRLNEAIIVHGLHALIGTDAETYTIDIVANGDGNERIFLLPRGGKGSCAGNGFSDCGVAVAQAGLVATCIFPNGIAERAHLHAAIGRRHLALTTFLLLPMLLREGGCDRKENQ